MGEQTPSTRQTFLVKRASLIAAIVSIALAIAIPLVVPANQQFEVLMLTFWFSGLGAILLNTASWYERQSIVRIPRFVVGLVLSVCGFATPFWRTLDQADQRFYVMIALGPLALAGLLLAWANCPWQAPVELPVRRANRSSMQARKKAVAHAPDNSAYRILMPISLGTLLAAIIIIVITVMIPPLLSVVR